MNDSTSRRFFTQYPFGVFIRFSRVHDYRKIKLLRNTNLPTKNLALNISRGVVIVIIETGLADRNDARISRQLLHLIKMARLCFSCIVWVYPKTRPDPIVSFSDRNPATHVVWTASIADSQNAP